MAGDAPVSTVQPGGPLRFASLDGLRGIAILLVALHHFLVSSEPFYGGIGRVVFGLAESAWCGVDLFFVLSGFLITGILLDGKGAPHFLRNFYMRRVLRIFPLYYGMLVLCLLVLPAALPFTSEMQNTREHQGWLWLFASNLIMVKEGGWVFVGGWLDLGHFWSLAVEEQFYLVWPLLILLTTRRQFAWVCLAAIAAAFVVRWNLIATGAHYLAPYVLSLARMDALAVGALLALFVREPGFWKGYGKHVRWFASLTGGALALLIWKEGGLLDHSLPLTQTIGFSLLAVFFGAVLLLAVQPTPPKLLTRFLGIGTLRSFGKYSYAFYILHVPLLPVFKILFPVTFFAILCGSYRVGLGIQVLLSTLTCLALSMLSWHLYEKHFIRLKKHFPSRPEPESPEPTTLRNPAVVTCQP